jgi:hypothetical protein
MQSKGLAAANFYRNGEHDRAFGLVWDKDAFMLDIPKKYIGGERKIPHKKALLICHHRHRHMFPL